MNAAAPAHVLTSPVLAGIPHCFSTRVGGVSSGIFDSLNLGNPSDLPMEQRDPPANIRENFRRIFVAMGCEGRALGEVHQVHGGVIAWADAERSGPDPKADAILTDDPRLVVAVRVADCTPILLSTADGRMVGAVHAGWRGVIAGVLPDAIAEMQRHGAESIFAAVGPCIGRDRFEVGPEVAAEFARVFGADDGRWPIVRPGVGDRSLVDLKEALRRQLVAAGVERFDLLPGCTYEDTSLFYSHRRDKGRTGRSAALIGPRGP
jgi:YfiH family protein